MDSAIGTCSVAAAALGLLVMLRGLELPTLLHYILDPRKKDLSWFLANRFFLGPPLKTVWRFWTHVMPLAAITVLVILF